MIVAGYDSCHLARSTSECIAYLNRGHTACRWRSTHYAVESLPKRVKDFKLGSKFCVLDISHELAHVLNNA